MKLTIQQIRQGLATIALAACGLGANNASAQLAANTYQFSAFSGTYNEITGGTALTAIEDDDALSGAIPIGFTFNYCGTDYTQLIACSNGWLSFNTSITSSYTGNSASSANDIKPALFPLWDDISGDNATARYITTGTAPNRVFTIEYKNWLWNYSAANPVISFEVKLYESSNLIQYIYRQESGAIDNSSSGASIGIADNDATAGYLSLNNTGTAPVPSSTTFTTNLGSKPATGQVYQFKPLPPIDMDADSIIVNTPFCSNSTQPVSARIKNLGTATINTVTVNWSVDGVTQTPVVYSTPVSNVITAPNNRATVALGNVFFPNSTPRVIKAWTYQPNSLADAEPGNDTVTQAITATLQGVEVKIRPNDTTICQGDNITLDAGSFPNAPIYIWSTGSLNQTISTSQAGQYGVKVQNNMGCFDRDTITISVRPEPAVNSIAVMDNGSNTYTFNAIGAQNIVNWAWDFGDGSTAPSGTGLPVPQQLHQYSTPGDYTVTLTLSNECNEIVTSKQIKIQPTGIGDLSALQKELKLYPNPGKSAVMLSSYNGALKIKEVVLYNLMGQQVYKASSLKGGEHRIDVSVLPAGIYNVVIDTDKGVANKKLEVLH